MLKKESIIPLSEILIHKSLEPHFQPIVSVVKKSITGLEALTRSWDPLTGEPIPPDLLFKHAEISNQIVPLDRICREKAINRFAEKHFNDDNLLLFLNFNPSVIDMGVVGSGHIMDLVEKANLSPRNIVIEIIESKVHDMKVLQKFVRLYKEHGFIIALDDVGAGYSNFDRLSLIQPEIVKIDRQLIKDIHTNYYKQEIFKALVNLSKKIGALVVAEGIETLDEALYSLQFGADMLQGFYFAKPQAPDKVELQTDKLWHTANEFQKLMFKNMSHENQMTYKFNMITENVLETISKLDHHELHGPGLKYLLNSHAAIESVFILDESGRQISDTVCAYDKFTRNKGMIFQPASKGADHSLKNYYFSLKNGATTHITEPYISLASGNLCLTISSLFHKGDTTYVLCIDINHACFMQA